MRARRAISTSTGGTIRRAGGVATCRALRQPAATDPTPISLAAGDLTFARICDRADTAASRGRPDRRTLVCHGGTPSGTLD